jgi:hypothetical protein
MDISKINIVKAATDGIDVDIINPATGKKTDLKIRVIGAMNAAYKDEIFLLRAEIEDFKEQNKLPADVTNKQKAEFDIKVDKFDDDLTAKFLAKYTIGWEGMEENGNPIPFSKEEAQRVYAEYPIILNQIQRAMTDLANFMKA